MLFGALLGCGIALHAAAPQEQPLLQKADITYLGAFALPTQTLGTSRYGYGGHAISTYKDPSSGKLTLFMQGHVQNDGQIGQVEVPSTFVKSSDWSSLPVARSLQNFSLVDEGHLGTIGTIEGTEGVPTYGTLAYNNRLIVAVSQFYGSDQHASHGVSGLTLSTTGDFHGYYGFTGATAVPRALGGWMTLIPPEWQTLLGGPALTGNCCIAIIGATSVGPAATVFDPDDVGAENPIPGTTLLFYPLGDGTMVVHSESSQNDTFNLTTRVGGMAFPTGSRSLLYFCGHGTGPYCYGTPEECGNDWALADTKGPHAQPYRYQILAYDVNDLLAVKNGTKPTYGPKPYGIWPITDITTGGAAVNIQGAGYDQETGQWFVSSDYGEEPRIDVFQITTPTAAAERVSDTDDMGYIAVSPNPFNPTVTIFVHTRDNSQPAQVAIYTLSGRFVADLTPLSAAVNDRFVWKASIQPSGVYIVKAAMGNSILTKIITLIK